jgi:NAD(P)-dependent dehydrogenase (short-subunit alcohol dehydrogenase family)
MEAAMPYSVADIPNLAGKLAVVSGATGGLGYETALGLAGAGATVILTGRNAQKGADALARIHAVHPGADIRYENLDLASLASVAEFAEKFLTAGLPLDILINNAGVMALPERELTADGFERQFQTNYLGHFALTQRLLPALRKADAPRVVPLSSIAARSGAIDFGNLQSERRYNPMVTYSQTKLACLMFAFELQRRSDANGWGLKSIAAHPGVSASSLIENGMGASSLASLAKRFVPFIFQPVPQGALPTLFAATSSEAKAGGYYGPDGFAETRGLPTAAKPPRQSLDIAVARRLWEVSEDLTGLRFPALARAA